MYYVDVILPQALPRNYTYGVPKHLEGKLTPGCRVAVQFGKKRKYAAVVKEIHKKEPQNYKVKEVLDLLDEEPIVYPEQLQFWEWMAQYYMCTEGEVMNAALPAFLKLTSETNILLNPQSDEDISALSDEEFLVAEALQIHKQLSIDEVQQVLNKKTIYPVINGLIQKGICLVNEELEKSYKPKKETFVSLASNLNNEERLSEAFKQLSRAPQQEKAFLAFLSLRSRKKRISKKELQKKAGVSSQTIKAIAEKGLLLLKKEDIDRISFDQQDSAEIKAVFTLNEEQQKGYEKVWDFFEKEKSVLLHGVTSSGKTMIYIRLIERMVKEGKQVLYLLPEIALTAQLIRRLRKYFGNTIAVYHSKFNNNERVEIWNKVKTGACKIVLGARSALMLPYKNLGLIVLDEEHDASYKQRDPAPRYHARDAALYYARLFDAHVIMGSATPSLESYHNALEGKYGLVTLRERYGGGEMPDLQIVDMKKIAFKKEGIRYLSPQLDAEIQRSLSEQKQVILFQNRRGYAPSVQCRVCGWMPKCKNCDVSLTYHKYHHRLHCHYCGEQYPVPEVCEACGSNKLSNRSFGTERVVEELSGHYPEATVERMDYDRVKNKYAHQKLIDRFERQEIDILVGTQMIVKGLDFGRVNLVGILNVDSLLSYPDFRLNERGFQLLTQVSGRSGRRKERGKVLLQAVNTEHPILEYVLNHDYLGFYEREIREREEFNYPPFSRIIKITLRHKKAPVVSEAGNKLRDAIKPYFKTSLLGPSAPLVGRVKNYYIMELMIKIPKNMPALHKVKEYLLRQFDWLQSQKGFSRVFITPDVDSI